MKILGIDPGTARLGWGIIKDKSGQQTVGDYGCIKTKKTKPDANRLKDLFDQLIKVIKTNQPNAIAIEDIFFFKNQKTIIKVSQARGVILLAAETLKIPNFSYSPLQIKMAVTGYGRADKNQVQQMVKTILKLKTIPKPDDTADALAVALTHSFTRKLKEKVRS
ncbi:MAG: crossover junction endodeoxyribonuclease RuvC [Patescibacteria group bacterium]|nr:crossover junction endodeoxyribonuclease RuvC [Patescibacteria group bacterium]